jgi:hypothetical protein
VVNAGTAGIEADRQDVQFAAGNCFTDVARVRQLASVLPDEATLEALEEAAALLRGELLDGLDLPRCHRFHHLCMAERERFGQLRRRVWARWLSAPAATLSPPSATPAPWRPPIPCPSALRSMA